MSNAKKKSTFNADSSLNNLETYYAFDHRHIGIDEISENVILKFLGINSLENLLHEIIPKDILISPKDSSGLNEHEVIEYLQNLLKNNDYHRSFIGMGYYGTVLPNVILRNVLENPGWYTAYTPYQSEIAQGRLEMLMNFQQMTIDFTGLDVACASLLDEATAAAEAMSLAYKVSKNRSSNTFYVDEQCHEQIIDVVKTRAHGVGIKIVIGDADDARNYDIFGILLAYTGTFGNINNYKCLVADLQIKKVVVAMTADIMSLVLLEAPGKFGVDIVLGTTQRFGVPIGFGGPHAAFFAVKDKYKRSLPGRIIGISIDTKNKPAFRMALQTREQHIRRDKATSNICTSQVLLANIAASYAIYHGPKGLKAIADRIHRLTNILAYGLAKNDIHPINKTWFDTLTFKIDDYKSIVKKAQKAKINLRINDTAKLIGVSLDEATTHEEIHLLWNIFLEKDHGLSIVNIDKITQNNKPVMHKDLQREFEFLTHKVFNSYHSETEMMRYLKRLEDSDIALNRSMIPLGSCTMKLNAATQMQPITWTEIANVHPFVPKNQVKGLSQMITELGDMLKSVSGFAEVSLQPNAGAQGEYAGLLAIRRFYQSQDNNTRNICLIPESAHGTNPASAVMCGMQVHTVHCDKNGNIDIEDLRDKASSNSENLAAFMITYPSTHGVFEKGIIDICDIIHKNGGQVYMDGANMNAMVHVAKPADFGADVMHFNLHKTFAIPHGGGGPGVGAIGVAEHLIPFIPGHSVIKIDEKSQTEFAVSAAPFGSAGVLPISWSYMKMMGEQALRKATAVAILNANYLCRLLEPFYPILYKGENGWCAHEFIIDLRQIKTETGITEEDIAKRLIDYGYHAPTMSFPVAGTLMIEPTESESKDEIDRFAQAMILICEEINAVKNGDLPKDNNPLVNAPHTLADLLEKWNRPYSREQGIAPALWVKNNKFWPKVNRVDNVHGDRNLIFSYQT